LWLFLDYDGTLAEFAPTPDTVLPDPEIIDLLSRLARYPDAIRVVIMSGRRFSHIQKLLPVPGILEAGAYGIEFITWQGKHVRLLDFETARPFLDQVRERWLALIEHRPGYTLEDKEYALALHARTAPAEEARATLAEAAQIARQFVQKESYRILGGNRYIEVAPTIADKGQSVSMLLLRFPWPGAEIVYIGDDDKDEPAFEVVLKNGGVPIVVAADARPTHALYRLESPREVKKWLEELVEVLERSSKNVNGLSHLAVETAPTDTKSAFADSFSPRRRASYGWTRL
jgi:trehalose 6-phosphate phosphatase